MQNKNNFMSKMGKPLPEDLSEKLQSPLTPEWVNKVEVPLISQFESEIKELSEKISSYQKQIATMEEKKKEIESYKKLLYSDGFELENISHKCLIELGGKVEPVKYSNEEYCLIYQDIEYPVKIIGLEQSISLSHLRQLIDYMLEYDEKIGTKCKGILLGNPWKNLPLEERNTNERPNFTPFTIPRAQDMNISLVSSEDLFKAFCLFIEDKITGDRILEKVVSSVGLVNLSELA